MRYLIFLALVLGLDIATKYIVQGYMLIYQTIPIIPGLLNFTYVENPGAAFGVLANLNPPWRELLFVSVSLIALVIVIILFFKCSPEEKWSKAALILILAGALGNLIDRVRLGVVVDFIDVYWQNYHWPAFNIADSAISIGVGMLIIDLFFKQREVPES
jgi:signal peptidase II